MDLAVLEKEQVYFFEEMPKRGTDTRLKWERLAGNTTSGNQIVDILNSEIKSEPLGTVKKIYASLDLELRSEEKANMTRWLEEQRNGGIQKFTIRKYKVKNEVFGLETAKILSRPVYFEYWNTYG